MNQEESAVPAGGESSGTSGNSVAYSGSSESYSSSLGTTSTSDSEASSVSNSGSASSSSDTSALSSASSVRSPSTALAVAPLPVTSSTGSNMNAQSSQLNNENSGGPAPAMPVYPWPRYSSGYTPPETTLIGGVTLDPDSGLTPGIVIEGVAWESQWVGNTIFLFVLEGWSSSIEYPQLITAQVDVLVGLYVQVDIFNLNLLGGTITWGLYWQTNYG